MLFISLTNNHTATQEQLSLAYQKTRQDAQYIRVSTRINQSNWEEFLGNSR